ncbi:hypothetical protein CBS101457_006701 [Exobasidium rhododendri]|nr:hypothetical protein CBS101457_006701 [Exobasidium rhododendri]
MVHSLLRQSRPLTLNLSAILACQRQTRFYSVPAPSAQAFLEPSSASVPGITLLTLNRPETKNAISQQMIRELEAAVEQARSDKNTRVLILRSAVPKTFCAGADLKERKSMSMDQVESFLRNLRRTFSAIENLPFPTIAALDGLAMGGGMELALCTDLRVASSTTDKLGLPETRLGIIPGAGGTYRMTKLIGPSKTKDLIFSSRLLNATEAHNLGIIDHLAKEGDATPHSIRLAEAIAVNGPIALRAAKVAIDRGQLMDVESALDWERACYEKCLSSKDRLEGLQAFAEKRKPRYTGE